VFAFNSGFEVGFGVAQTTKKLEMVLGVPFLIVRDLFNNYRDAGVACVIGYVGGNFMQEPLSLYHVS